MADKAKYVLIAFQLLVIVFFVTLAIVAEYDLTYVHSRHVLSRSRDDSRRRLKVVQNVPSRVETAKVECLVRTNIVWPS